jgi:hypothetical protein
MISWLLKLFRRDASPGDAMTPAGEVTPTPEIDHARSTRTRAAVRAEFDQARAAGRAPEFGEASAWPELAPAQPGKTREQVKAELDEYVRSGQRDRDQGQTQIGG